MADQDLRSRTQSLEIEWLSGKIMEDPSLSDKVRVVETGIDPAAFQHAVDDINKYRWYSKFHPQMPIKDGPPDRADHITHYTVNHAETLIFGDESQRFAFRAQDRL